MSIRERLLGSIASFLVAIKTDSIAVFEADFGCLLIDLQSALKGSGLSTEDKRLAAEVSSAIEKMASGFDELDTSLASAKHDLVAQVDSELAAEDDCSGSSPPLLLLLSLSSLL